MGSSFVDFLRRYQGLKQHQDTSDQLIADLLRYCKNVEEDLREENRGLQEKLQNASLDLTDATKSRRALQQNVNKLEAAMSTVVKENEHLKNYNPYIVILLDGDGLFFKESFVDKGVDGGKQAAYALRTAALQGFVDYADEVTVIAKLVANLGGLAKAMRRDGCLVNEADLKNFTLGFSQSMASFDFVDIGQGKERTDTKIKEALRWNLQNLNCKQILLGISHDSGYASFLDEILRDERTRRRVFILEGFPTVRELKATGLEILNYTDTLFRSEKLIDKTQRNQTPPTSVFAPLAAISHMSPLPGSAPPSYSAVIGNASPSPQISLPIPPVSVSTTAQVQARPKPSPVWNPGSRGLDPPLVVNQAVLDTIKKRKENKLCNNHYLRGPCTKGDSCCFDHKYKPSAEEKVAIAFLARLNPCTSGQDCEVKDCIYGHHCPSTTGGQCAHPYCKFKPWEHPPGTKFRATYPWIEEVW
ncbi:CCCH zinc finger dna binding protein [Pleurostoma richardsiae]|uniref:CCCH zinc finger dna binding protein n=1 Tax=Pleurostoma richardsiae TaxID=41990 RepID=A0AA38VBT3_9PEZI|nr:CCCH zinc finger dna binding protein [Pleurostoma richardsiae]